MIFTLFYSQTMLFPAPSHNHRCEQSRAGNLRTVSHTRCSCDSSYSAPSGFSRLLPAISSNDQNINPSNLTVSIIKSWKMTFFV